MPGLRVDILTLFPAMFEGVIGSSIVGRARARGLVDIRFHDFRGHADDRHRSVDGTPYGGGPGMVLRPEPLIRAVEAVPGYQNARLVLLSPIGERFSQPRAADLARSGHLILICGHYEGFDERVRLILQPEEISIGDYVLTGGELAAMVIVDATTRLQPGALGDDHSAVDESFAETAGAGPLLEYPHYTRPHTYRGFAVPEVLRSGHHQRIADWRADQAHRRTRARRPDLLDHSQPEQPDGDAEQGDESCKH